MYIATSLIGVVGCDERGRRRYYIDLEVVSQRNVEMRLQPGDAASESASPSTTDCLKGGRSGCISRSSTTLCA